MRESRLPPAHAARRFPGALAAAAALLVVAWVYRDLPRVYFDADDFLNLYQIANLPLGEYLLQTHGGHILVARNAIFYLFRAAFGPRPELFFTAVLLTHLFNVALLFRVLRRLTRSSALAVLGAVSWGASPVQAGALGWYSVYGQVAAATVLLLLLDRAAAASSGEAPLSRTAPVLWPLLLLLGCTSFGVGIAVAVVAPAVAFLVLPPSRRRTALCLALLALVVALPFFYDWLLALNMSLTGQTLWRGTTAATLSYGIHKGARTLTMLVYLLNYGTAALLLGFFSVKAAFPSVFAWAALATFTAGVLLVAARGDSSARRWTGALALLALSVYAIIAVARAPLFQPDALARTAASTRYHYAATIPLAILACLALAHLGRALSLPPAARRALLAAWAALVLFAYARAPEFLNLHPWQRRETEQVVDGIARAVHAAAGPTVYIHNALFRSVGLMLARDETRFPGWAGVYTIFFPADELDGKRVRFVVDDPEAAAEIQRGRRTAELVVARQNVPAGAAIVAPQDVVSAAR